MGLRGPLPLTKVINAKRLADLSPPDWLSDAGKAHWTRHAEGLNVNGLLTVQTADSLALCCDLWGRLAALRDQPTSRTYLDTLKAYTSIAKVFRLLPCDKPGIQTPDRHAEKDAFEF